MPKFMTEHELTPEFIMARITDIIEAFSENIVMLQSKIEAVDRRIALVEGKIERPRCGKLETSVHSSEAEE